VARVPVDRVNIISGYGMRIIPAGKPGHGQFPGFEGHWALDLQDGAGKPVRAPEAGTVTATWTDDKTPPWAGYGPGGVEIAGVSGVYHVLAHQDPGSLLVGVGDQVAEGEQLGTVSTLGHVHWEVRKVAIDSPDTRAGDTVPPIEWLDSTDPHWVDKLSETAPSKATTPWWLWAVALWIVAKGRR
jgi:murein DD-endopeptidase MepM/ murein hydrolase activator NlpD